VSCHALTGECTPATCDITVTRDASAVRTLRDPDGTSASCDTSAVSVATGFCNSVVISDASASCNATDA